LNTSNRPGAPLFATVNITGVCNLACRYCFYQPRRPDVMPWLGFRRVVDELAEASVFFVNISGGEPFTHPEAARFIRYAHERFYHVVVLTNGTILDPGHQDVIKEIVERKGTFPIQVSLDSIQPEVNSITRCHPRRVETNLGILQDLGARIVIAMVITRHNIEFLPASIASLTQYTRHFHLMPFQAVKALAGADRDCQASETDLADFWRQAARLREELGLDLQVPQDDACSHRGCAMGAPCMAAFSHLVIDADLRVRPCDRVVDVTIGDLQTANLSEIWRSDAALNITHGPLPLCVR
jgi:MoaA/NifB/PqqE/SkfB family radical SAM enzyme